MNTDSILPEIRKGLERFHTSPCQLVHERISDIQPAEPDSAGNETFYIRRPGFCNRGIRDQRLGCAHSLANDAFIALVEKMYTCETFAGEPSPVPRIKELLLSIYLMDHEKNDFEKRRAISGLKGEAGEDDARLELAIRELLVRHRKLISELENIRYRVVSRLKQELEG